MKSYNVLVLAVALGAALVHAADEVTTERFPDADIVVIDECERVTYNPDGTYEQTEEIWTKLLTEKGRRDESAQRLDYSKRYGEAEFVYVGVIGADGQERTIDVSATTNEATDNGSMGSNIYDPLDRVINCTIPGLKVGDILHLKTRRSTFKPRCEGKWADISVMEWSHPIMRTSYVITAPKALPLKKIVINHPLGNIVTNMTVAADGSTVYEFTATNSAQVFPEPDMPALHTQVQNIRVSTAESWQEISKWYWALCESHLAKTNAAMVAKVAELKGMREIFKFVSQEVRYMGLTMEDTSPGYAPHDVDITFNNRYGVCRDKAGLLVTMLRMAGFKAFPVLIHVGTKHDPAVPQPFFNHAIVAVEKAAGAYELMDPTNENAKDLFPAYLCDKSYLVCRPEGETLLTSPVPDPETNRLVAETRGKLNNDGSIFVECAIDMNGINDTAYRHALVKKTPEDRVKFFERVLKSVQAGAELAKCEIEPTDMRDTECPIRIRLAAKLPEMSLDGATRSELTAPFFTKTLGIVNFLLSGNTALVERRYPLVLDTTATVRERVTIDLGESLGEVVSLPARERITGPYGYELEYAVTNGTLIAKREQTIAAVEFSPKEYGELKENLKAIEAIERRNPVFGKDDLADADVCYLLDSEETAITGEREWVTTNTIVKEVLDYKGKKSAAELKIAFNQSWKHLELVEAVVSNRDGRVSRVTEREINLMDCGWAAKAPRYPASKLLVVNLPSVEIGSVISYTLVTTVTNAPAGFYAAYVFDSHEPLGCRVVRVDDWRREVVRPQRLAREVAQPDASLWRDEVIVASNRFERMDLALEELDPSAIGIAAGDDLRETLRRIRDWMAINIKVCGPSLYEVRLEDQLTPVATVLAERYATRLDYLRTMAALLRGAGIEADVILAAQNAGDPAAIRERDMKLAPRVRAFNNALCRVRLREGGWWFGWGSEEKVYFIGTENQYAELGASAYAGSDYYDPASGEFGIVTVPEEKLADYDREESVWLVREDGSVDLEVVNRKFGSAVGGFRKMYAELLPEERSRRYQSILGDIAQAATATSPLKTDIEGYPAVSEFACHLPDFAIADGDTLTLTIPPLVSSLPSLTGQSRKTPFEILSSDPEGECVTIRFPKGYTQIEHLPTALDFADPLDATKPWMATKIDCLVIDDALEVTISREVARRDAAAYGSEYFELIKDWSRLDHSRANRTIVVRRRLP